MEFGIGAYPTHDSIHPATLARMVEERGHNTSLCFAEHTHIPASLYEERAAPRRLSHLHDPFIALTAAAMATTSLRIGTGICLVVDRDPIITAKQVASLDVLSGGRFEFGVGLGWVRQGMLNHGTEPRTRTRLMAERIGAMKEIWANDEASYDGEFVKFDRILSWPKPLQRPHPPIFVGGDGPTVFDRVLAYGDGWLPNMARDPRGGEEIIERVEELRARADRHIDIVVVSVPADPAVLERLAKAGCRRAVHWMPATGPTGVQRSLDRWEAAITEMTGEAESVHQSTADSMGERMTSSRESAVTEKP